MLKKIDCKPVFIVGMNGSGTTMLLDCLNNHNELYGFRRETKVIPYYIKNLDKYGDLSKDKNFLALFNEYRELSTFRYKNHGEPVPLPENWEELPRDFASIVDSVFLYYAEMEGKKRWCEKTPMHAQHIVSIGNFFPQSKFIHIIRDGRACSASFYRRWKFNPTLAMYRWKNVVQVAQRQGAKIGDRYMEVHYEELTESPETIMRNICSFLKIEYSDSLLEVSRKRKFTGSSATKIVSNKKTWKNILSEKQVGHLELIGGKMLNNLGYETQYPHSDKNPNKVRLKLLKYWDFLRFGLKTVLNEIKRPKDQKWDDISAILIRAIKQRIVSKF